MTGVQTCALPISKRCVQILAAYRTHCAVASQSGQLILPESYKLFPLYVLCVLKSRAFRGGKLVSSDLRVYTMRLIQQMGVSESSSYLYPNLMSVGEYAPGIAELDSYGLVKVPPMMRVSAERLHSTGIYLAGNCLLTLENGRHLFLWVGKDVLQSTLLTLFNVPSLAQIDSSAHSLVPSDSPHSIQLTNLIKYFVGYRARYMQLTIVRQGFDQSNDARFLNLMIEDQNMDAPSYVDFLCNVHRQIQSQIST